ncbi:MAG TPA: PatB family C-S lyase [Burkholderiales bacterium]|nr:PatB family C-S lyase [Burkholderiales bacterium]
MDFDFDTPVDRAGTWSTRWERHAGADVIPLWVADTDFRAAPAILEALAARAAHGVFGYSTPPPELRGAIVRRMQQRYGWRIDASWIVFIPGVVPGLHLAARHLVPADGHALIPRPVYHHFRKAMELAPRAFSEAPLVLESGRWVFDTDALKRSINAKTRAFFLCNPQNPGGTVFRRSELERLAEVTRDLVIVSDEIHCDLVLEPDLRHVPIASLAPEISRRTVTLMSANKTFNIPAAGLGWAIIEDVALRGKFSSEVAAHVLGSPSVFGMAATLAALERCDDWLAALLAYLRGNRDLVEKEIGFPMAHIEATYLAWIDCSAIEDAAGLFLKHGVSVYSGAQFGDPRFIRLNFGTQRSRLQEALKRISASLTTASRPSPRG